jgi:hypothetical protein
MSPEHAQRASNALEASFGNLLETTGREQRQTVGMGETPKVALLHGSATGGD